MTDHELATALNQIRRAAGRAEGGVSDAELLGRFAATGDEAAFELLVRRHQALVLGVCRRVLNHLHEAEDAFQATFLLLARKARSISNREALAGWLYKVAYRAALTARAGRAKRVARERPIAAAADVPTPPDPAAAPEGRELREVVDEEVSRLPERIRAAAALCYLEGKTVEEAAQQLGCPRGTVASRLARARQRLRSRLTRRGLALPAGAALPGIEPPALASEALIRAATRCAAAGADIPARVGELTEEVMRAMFVKRFITAAVLVAVAGALLFGGALTMQIQAGGEERQAQDAGRVERPVGEPKPVTVAHPTWHYPRLFQDYLGRLVAHKAVDVRPGVDGVLGKIHIKPGEFVKKGDLLFEIDPRVYKAEVEKAEQDVKVKEAESKRQAAALERIQRLAAEGAVAHATLDKSSSKAEVASAALRVAQAALDVARQNLKNSQVLAPISGRVFSLKRGAVQGVSFGGTLVLATITPAGTIGLHFEMDERSLLQYRRLAAEGKVRESGGPLYAGLADEDGFPHEATLTRFDDQVNASKGTIGVHGTLPNPGGILLPGMSARVRMPFTKQRRSLAVPNAAVVTEGGKHFVWVVGKGGVAERRAVKAGAKEGRLRLIESGLRPDERVITGGTDGLRPGERVEPRRPGAKE